MASTITRQLLDNAMSYEEFKQRVSDLYEEGRPTSGEDSDAPLLEFTKLNINRLSRNEKSNTVNPELASLLSNFPKSMYWLVLAEGWCGDVAESLPILYNLTKPHDHIQLGVIFRDQNLDIMDQYLTNGGRGIPKLIMLDNDNLEELAHWGPRPEPIQSFVDEKKQELDQYETKMDWVNSIHEGMHKWYAKDKGQTLQEEIKDILKSVREQVTAS